ncbi:MAG: HAMP domain-containing histidine kinase [Lachnospiraceae bacterium]|nr:HAMP domain-containing histidine kinase [Lachnospiraceae bacterium]
MKSFRRIFIIIVLCAAAIFTAVNLFLSALCSADGRPHRVELSRLAEQLRRDGPESIDLSGSTCITAVVRYDGSGDFFDGAESDYALRLIDGELYRFDYSAEHFSGQKSLIIAVNLGLAAMAALLFAVLLFVRRSILLPFCSLANVPYELSRRNLAVPLKENKSRFFGRFVWGIDLLRERLEQQKQRELALQRDRKTQLLSVSHDIKTPLSAIRLYASALSRRLYPEPERQSEIALRIRDRADEIESFVAELIKASGEDFPEPEIKIGDFYLSWLVRQISSYYTDKLALVHTDFQVGRYSDCLLKGDPDRAVEVLQNIMENAVKYGDGGFIRICFSEEEGCVLITVENSGSSPAVHEMPHIFDSFWRGSNSEGKSGSGLGLSICRRLMNRMDGEVFAAADDGAMRVTAVFRKL